MNLILSHKLDYFVIRFKIPEAYTYFGLGNLGKNNSNCEGCC